MKDQTNDIINSLDQMERASAPDFFYAKIRAKMERQQKSTAVSFSLKPVLVTAVLFIFLLANISFLSKFSKSEEPAVSTTTVNSFAQEYNLNVQTVAP